LTEDGNVEISGRDLREGPEPTFHRPPIAGGGPKAAIDRDVSQEPR
jgi:hypothetical protein